MKKLFVIGICATLIALLSFSSCKSSTNNSTTVSTDSTAIDTGAFRYYTEQFADIRILRYNVEGFNELSSKQKELLYYLYMAALSGRDIIWDQNCKYNLTVRHTLEAIVNANKDRNSGQEWEQFMVYAKRIWFSNGIHHHYGSEKILPEFSKEYFITLLKGVEPSALPLMQGESAEDFSNRIIPILFDAGIASKKVNKDPGVDMIKESATNFYEGVTLNEVDAFYQKMSKSTSEQPPLFGLNSKVVKENDSLVEKTWKVGGMYHNAIEKIVFWLKKASEVAENDTQKKTIDLLVKFYESGDLKTFDEYNIAWVADTLSRIDFVNGFIEVYGDPVGHKGSYESVVSIKDLVASKRIATIGSNAQWFEDNSTILPEHKKKNVKGISAKVITVVIESGDASPSTPIGINLPNSNWIRQVHGSKSVNLGNIVDAYDNSPATGYLEEFFYSKELIERTIKYGAIADKLHTDMHEVIGHASGVLNKGVQEPHKTLKNYASTLEEARADLVALYYLYDKKLVELGVMESLETGKAAYDDYISNGLMLQLKRLKLGDDIEEDHMRNRQLVAAWAYEKGKKDNVIEKKIKDGKTFFIVNDYEKLRVLFGELLREIQKIKSEGNYLAGKELVEKYGVKVDQQIHKEVLERYAKLNIAPYQGFINPKLVPVMENNKIIDVKIEYPTDFMLQMLEYGKDFSLLPAIN